MLVMGTPLGAEACVQRRSSAVVLIPSQRVRRKFYNTRVRQVAARMDVAIIEMVPSETEAGWFELQKSDALNAIKAPPPATRAVLNQH